MITTLDQLETYIAKQQKLFGFQKLLKEVKIFGIIFLTTSALFTIVTNRKLFCDSVQDMRKQRKGGNKTQETIIATHEQIVVSPGATTKYSEVMQEGEGGRMHHTPLAMRHKTVYQQEGVSANKELIQKLDFLINAHTPLSKTTFPSQEYYVNVMKKKLNTYGFSFNTLPPTNRLIIPKANQNIPLVEPAFGKPIEEVEKGDFIKELYKGVVRYPTTAIPGKPGNTLIFGHTSYESREHNPYATIFRSLGKLQVGDVFQIVREGQLYTYTIIEKKIVKPKQVNNEFIRYNKENNNFVTLMGCYPFGSDAERILVIGELVKGNQRTF